MKYLIAILFTTAFIINTDAYGQSIYDLEPISFTAEEPCVDEPGSRLANWMPILYISVITLEVIFLTGSYFTRFKAGSYTVGALQGIYALSAGIASLTGSGDYGVMAPLLLVGGLGTLAWYNFKHADIHSNNRKFLTNFIGLNATVGLAVLAIVVQDQFFATANGALQLSGSAMGLGLTWNF